MLLLEQEPDLVLERTDSLQAEQLPSCTDCPGPNRSNSSSAVVSGTNTSARDDGNESDAAKNGS